MSNAPRLRAQVVLQAAPSGSGAVGMLVDPELGQQVKLKPDSWSVACRLARERDGALPPALPGAELAQPEPAAVEEALALLDRLRLLETPAAQQAVEDARQTRRWRDTPAAEVPLLIRPDARFGCTICGSCCGNQSLGPVQPEILQGLWERREALAQQVPTDRGFFVSLAAPGGGPPQVLCQLRDGFCVFLGDDGYCVVHRDHGGDAKPHCCTIFPYMYVATPDGIAVSLQMECRSHHLARRGPRLVDQEDEIRRIYGMLPSVRAVPPVILLDARTSVSWREYCALEDALHEVVEQQAADPFQALLGLRQTLIARGLRPESEPIREPLPLQQELDALVRQLRESLEVLRQRFSREDEQHVVHTASLAVLARGLSALRPYWRLVTRGPAAGEPELFADLFHNRLMAKRLIDPPPVKQSLARLIFSWFWVRAVLVDRARQMKRRHFTPQDVTDAITLVTFHWHDKEFREELERHDPALTRLFFDQLPALLEQAAQLPDASQRVEIYKY